MGLGSLSRLMQVLLCSTSAQFQFLLELIKWKSSFKQGSRLQIFEPLERMELFELIFRGIDCRPTTDAI